MLPTLKEVITEFTEAVYARYQQDAFNIDFCGSQDLSPEFFNEMRLRIDLLSHCNVFKCNTNNS